MRLRQPRSLLSIVMIVFWLTSLACLTAGVRLGRTQESPGSGSPLDLQEFISKARGSWTIDAARISYDPERKTYEASGNVRIVSGDRAIQADWAILDSVNRTVELRGNVFLQFKKDWLRGEHVRWNLDEETGVVDGGLAYFAENKLYTKAERIEKTSETEYEVKRGVLTSCDPQNPDWTIRYGSLKVDTEGSAWAKNSSFWLWRLPVLYSPILMVPFQRERKSGFLLPWGGYSDLNGVQGELPYYWAIRQDMDATFFARVMEKRGVMGGLEFRINNDTWGEGIWMVNFLNDLADKSELLAEGFAYETDERYWIRSRHSFQLPHDIVGRLDLDLASDRNFFREFTGGSASVEYTDKLFREGFGRGVLNDENAQMRESSLYMERPTESSLISMDTRYWDQLNQSLNASTMQRLPSFGFTIAPTGIGDTPLYYSLASSLTNYHRQEGDHGNRIDVRPRWYLPFQWKNYLDVEAAAGFNASSYYVEWENRDADSFAGRAVTDARLTLSSRVNRVFPVQIGNTVALQHSIRPELLYEYVPEPLEGSHIPLFDRLDINPARHRIQYGFSTFLTSKSMTKDVASGEETPSYQELARLRGFHGYNFVPANRDPQSLLLDMTQQRGVTDIGLRLDISPKKYLTLSYDVDVSVDELSAPVHDLYLIYRTGRGDLLRVDYQYRAESVIDELITRLNVAVLPNLYFIAYHDYSFDQQELFAQGYGFRYDHGCWALGVSYENKDNDHRVAVTVNLLGLGSFGGSRTYNEGGP